MAEINEKEVVNSYKKLFMWLMIVSMLINLITLFVPIFHIDFLGIKHSELGIKYLRFDMTDDTADKYEGMYGDYYPQGRPTPSTDMSFKDRLDVDSDFLSSEDFIWKQAIRVILFAMIFIASCPLLLISKRFNKIANYTIEQKTSVYCSGVKINFWLNTIYMVLSVLLCWILLNEWEFEGAMTFTFIPWIFQLAVFICNHMLAKHMKRALKGEVAPIRFGSYAIMGGSSMKDTEEDKVELLMKYKELLDSGVITEEEYNAKKKELL